MELKVWFDGLPRIVCGVNDKTTCQDIVFALAQATGKTGRFTLIERWRNNDRLLAPSEVVMKWGEHSSDVQYILQCAAIDPKKTSNPATPNAETLPKTSVSPQDDTPTAPPPYRNPPSPGKPPTKSPGKELPPYRLPPPPNPNPPLMNVPEQSIRTEASSVTEAQELTKDGKPSHEYKDLIHLINCQREKLTAQQAELTKHDAEIMFWETKARIQERNMEAITKEMTRLEILSLQNDAESLVLKDVEEKNDSIVAEAERLREETDALRNALSHCDQELSTCRIKIRSLEESLASAEVERLRQEVATACEETDTISGVAGSLEIDVSSLAVSLGKKKAEMEELVSAMKEANLESLGMGEDESFRSKRRIRGSARQLKDAAPTTKNPIGVWV